MRSKQFWYDWFLGFNDAFLGLGVPKLLIVSSLEVLDRQLTTAQMQGAFEVKALANPFRSHFFHEDSPDELFHIILDFLKKRSFLTEEYVTTFPRSNQRCVRKVLSSKNCSLK